VERRPQLSSNITEGEKERFSEDWTQRTFAFNSTSSTVIERIIKYWTPPPKWNLVNRIYSALSGVLIRASHWFLVFKGVRNASPRLWLVLALHKLGIAKTIGLSPQFLSASQPQSTAKLGTVQAA